MLPHINPWSNEVKRGPAFGYRWLTGGRRAKPDYVVIGAARCGTTSLQAYLREHPQVRAPIGKELHFFDHNYCFSERWYRAHFPKDEAQRSWRTGEATPYYLCHPLVPGRVAAALPTIKLIVLLRDPVDRALSQYHMASKEYAVEPLNFEDALAAEDDRLAGEIERLVDEPNYFSFEHIFHGYKERGYYATHLRRWFDHFGREQVLVLRSEDFFRDTVNQFVKVLDFLSLPRWTPTSFAVHNNRTYAEMRLETRRQLEEHFAAHNDALARLLGRPPLWAPRGAG